MRHLTNIAVARARLAGHRRRHALAKKLGRTRRTTQARYLLALENFDRVRDGIAIPYCSFAKMVELEAV